MKWYHTAQQHICADGITCFKVIRIANNDAKCILNDTDLDISLAEDTHRSALAHIYQVKRSNSNSKTTEIVNEKSI